MHLFAIPSFDDVSLDTNEVYIDHHSQTEQDRKSQQRLFCVCEVLLWEHICYLHIFEHLLPLQSQTETHI